VVDQASGQHKDVAKLDDAVSPLLSDLLWLQSPNVDAITVVQEQHLIQLGNDMVVVVALIAEEEHLRAIVFARVLASSFLRVFAFVCLFVLLFWVPVPFLRTHDSLRLSLFLLLTI
jgi:hypothetical protein